jgi:hypothetical protein
LAVRAISRGTSRTASATACVWWQPVMLALVTPLGRRTAMGGMSMPVDAMCRFTSAVRSSEISNASATSAPGRRSATADDRVIGADAMKPPGFDPELAVFDLCGSEAGGLLEHDAYGEPGGQAHGADDVDAPRTEAAQGALRFRPM